MNQAWPDIYVEGDLHQFLPGSTQDWVSRYPLKKHHLDDHPNHPDQHMNNQKLCDE